MAKRRPKIRLDELLVHKEYALTVDEACGMIRAGKVFVDDNCSDKPGELYHDQVRIRVKQECKFVSRGGLKLEKGLHYFNLDVNGMICVDIGASSGGFTDCLLHYGAKHVYAVDVAYGQFAWKLRQNKKVTLLERFNARKLTKNEISETVDLAVIDASFISLRKLIPPLLPLLNDKKNILALVKPQFELPREKVGKGGVVRDALFHTEAIESVVDFCRGYNLDSEGFVPSPILGPKGNKEFIVSLAAST